MADTFKRPSLFQTNLIGEKKKQLLDRRPERSVPVDDYSARDRFASSEPYNPDDYNMSPWELFTDTLQSIPSGAASLAESIPGIPGDLSDAKYDLARWINKKTGLSHRSATPNKVVDWMEQADPVSRLPTTDDIAENVTDPLLKATGTEDIFRYQPKGPYGKAASTAVQAADIPLGWTTKIPKIAAQMLKRGVR